MQGKELIRTILEHNEAPRPAWVPYAGIHAGKTKGYNAIEVLQDSDKLLESLLEVHKLYSPDGQTVMFDLQLEAEILGCELAWVENNLPSVVSHPLAETDDIPDRLPGKEEGRLPMVWDVMRRFKKEVGADTALYGLFCGPFTLASHLRGTNIFMNMIKKPDYLHKLLEYTTQIACTMVDYYAEEGMDVIVPVDPLMSQISPKHFETFFLEPYSRLFEYIRQKGAFSSFFVCGNAIHNIEKMCRCVPDAVAVDENVNMVAAKQITDRYNVVLGGNIPLTTVMLFGNQQDNMKYTVDMLDEIEEAGLSVHRNLIVAPGCDMPYDVPPQNAVAVAQAVQDTEHIRKLVKDYSGEDSFSDVEVNLPDYDSLEKPLLEAFLLDPVACAACTYMLAAAESAKQELGGEIDFAEYRYNNPDDIARIQSMGVSCLPSIYINGELAYPSIIPSTEELVGKLKEAMK
ncbi:MAG: uroporphyrinogen decarboxylase family protein [Spirochaetota bacterium]